jgi:hypothetical protein
VAIAPLMVKNQFGVATAKFALEPYFTTDVIVEESLRTEFLQAILKYIFKNTAVVFADLTFPAETSNFTILSEACRSMRLKFENGAVHWTLCSSCYSKRKMETI